MVGPTAVANFSYCISNIFMIVDVKIVFLFNGLYIISKYAFYVKQLFK